MIEHGDDGVYTVGYSDKNNAQGLELADLFCLAFDGTFTESHITGTLSFSAVVDEHFELPDGC